MAEPEWSMISLRRDGGRPLRFQGRLLCGHERPHASAAVWHELFLYEMRSGGFVVSIEIGAYFIVENSLRHECKILLSSDIESLCETLEMQHPITFSTSIFENGTGLQKSGNSEYFQLHSIDQYLKLSYGSSVGAFFAKLASVAF